MSDDVVIDAYAWIEYFRGTPAGATARRDIESDAAATSTTTLAELREKYLREKWPFLQSDLDFITSRTALIAVDRPVALLAGEINHADRCASEPAPRFAPH